MCIYIISQCIFGNAEKSVTKFVYMLCGNVLESSINLSYNMYMGGEFVGGPGEA